MRLHYARSFHAWPLLAASALIAATVGHALQLWLEDIRLLGQARADYVHSGQAMLLELALLGLLVVGYCSFRRLLTAGTDPSAAAVPPVLAAVVSLGRARCIASVVGLQLSVLSAVEIVEQRLSGVAHPGLAAIYGPEHISALFVYLAVGVLVTLLTFALAAVVVVQSFSIARRLGTVMRRLRSAATAVTHAYAGRSITPSFCAGAPPLALGFANRPPPHSTLA